MGLQCFLLFQKICTAIDLLVYVEIADASLDLGSFESFEHLGRRNVEKPHLE